MRKYEISVNGKPFLSSHPTATLAGISDYASLVGKALTGTSTERGLGLNIEFDVEVYDTMYNKANSGGMLKIYNITPKFQSVFSSYLPKSGGTDSTTELVLKAGYDGISTFTIQNQSQTKKPYWGAVVVGYLMSTQAIVENDDAVFYMFYSPTSQIVQRQTENFIGAGLTFGGSSTKNVSLQVAIKTFLDRFPNSIASIDSPLSGTIKELQSYCLTGFSPNPKAVYYQAVYNEQTGQLKRGTEYPGTNPKGFGSATIRTIPDFFSLLRNTYGLFCRKKSDGVIYISPIFNNESSETINPSYSQPDVVFNQYDILGVPALQSTQTWVVVIPLNGNVFLGQSIGLIYPFYNILPAATSTQSSAEAGLYRGLLQQGNTSGTKTPVSTLVGEVIGIRHQGTFRSQGVNQWCTTLTLRQIRFN